MIQLPFKISSALKNVIGRDLITDDFIAVYELVKNSYDAHASKVVLKFGWKSIEIKDNGKGMTFQDIRDKWLFVAYSAKKTGAEDDDLKSEELMDYRNKIVARKHYAGAKGIGRFSCDRLGGKLDLYSKKVGSPLEVHHLGVDWSEFEANSETEFVDVNVNYECLNAVDFPEFENGTILKITDLNAIWDREKIIKLKQSLEKLINPFEAVGADSKVNSFSIEIDAPHYLLEDASENGSDREKANGPVKSFVFEALELKTTQIRVEIIGDEVHTLLIDRGKLIYEIKEPNNEFGILSKTLEKCVFHVFYLNSVAKNNFTRLMGIQPVRFGSIFLFKNGFRVMPYGEYRKDLWGLESRKTQGYARYLGTRELVGRIELFGESDQFREVSSRDGGLVNTEAYSSLINAFYEKCIRRLERYVIDIQWVDIEINSEDRNREDLSALNSLESKARIIKLINNLVSAKDVVLVNYAKDFLDIVNEKIEEAPEGVFLQLARLAESTQDDELASRLRGIEREYQRSLKEAADAEKAIRKAEEDRRLEEGLRVKAEHERKIAEERAAFETEARKRAELSAKEELEKRQLAQLRTIQEENKRKEAELKAREETLRRQFEAAKRKEAELKALEQENLRKEAEALAEEEKRKALVEEELRIAAEQDANLHKLKSENLGTQVMWYKSKESLDITDVMNIHHQIGIDAEIISVTLLDLKRTIEERGVLKKEDVLDGFEGISMAIRKILAITKFTTKKSFLKASRTSSDDIVQFIKNYLDEIYRYYFGDDMQIEIESDDNHPFVCDFKPIEISILVDNLLANSKNHGATKVRLSFKNEEVRLVFAYSDNGSGLHPTISAPEVVFERGFTTTDGSGQGMAHVKSIIEDMGGGISISNNISSGILITITIPR